MERTILLVDDQRDILRLLHSTIDTLHIEKAKIIESPSGEEALLSSSRHKIDLLVTDYMLPGMSGVELMHKVRARHPEAQVIFITGMTDRKMREEMLAAGAQAIFDKPIPLADFLDAAERSLGLQQPSSKNGRAAERHARLSDLLANFHQDIKASAVFLLDNHGQIQVRAGKLYDTSMEVSLISALMAIHDASLKAARFNHQETLDSYHVFSGGDHDLLFIPVNPLYALLVAGNGLATESLILETVNSLLALRTQVERSLKSMGVTGELNPLTLDAVSASQLAPEPVPVQTAEPPADESTSSPEFEALLSNAPAPNNADDFWNQAAEKLGSQPAGESGISLEDARRLGIIPDGN
jgi:CheY-like chemotaxis protein